MLRIIVWKRYNIFLFNFQVTERLKCYRPELGIIMEKILGLYKKIFRKFLDLAMKSEKQLVESTKTSSKETMETIERLKLEKLMADDKIKGYRKLFEAQETQAKIQEFNITSLQEEIQMLYSMVQKDQIPQTGRDEEEEANDKNRKMKYIKIATELEERVAYFQQSILNLEEEQSKKETSIKAMNHLIKAMLVSAKQDQATQVNESELLATVFELHYHDRPNITSDDVNLQAGSGVNIQPHLVSSLNHIDKIAGVDTSELNSLKDVQPSKDLTTERLLTEPQYGQKMTMADMKNLVQSISDNWNLPVNIVVFLENVTKNKDAAGVLPWNFFKKIIFDVYIDRLSQANEMQNNLVTTFVPTSEYLCLYFLRVTCYFLIISRNSNSEELQSSKCLNFLLLCVTIPSTGKEP